MCKTLETMTDAQEYTMSACRQDHYGCILMVTVTATGHMHTGSVRMNTDEVWNDDHRETFNLETRIWGNSVDH